MAFNDKDWVMRTREMDDKVYTAFSNYDDLGVK